MNTTLTFKKENKNVTKYNSDYICSKIRASLMETLSRKSVKFGETLTSKVDGNREPSRWYTSGRCRDYLGASVHLITGESVPRPTSKAGGDDILHAPVKAGNQS